MKGLMSRKTISAQCGINSFMIKYLLERDLDEQYIFNNQYIILYHKADLLNLRVIAVKFFTIFG